MSCFSKPILSKPQGLWTFGNCYYNATYNKYNCFSHIRGLKVVYGSLGFNDHFEYGGKTWGAKQFYDAPFDSHAWLEDADGNVYDYIFPKYAWFAEQWGKTPTFATKWEVCGISRAELKEEGLEYVPAPRAVQKDILNNVRKMYDVKFRAGVLPRISFDNVA